MACALFYFDYLTSVRNNGSLFLGVSGKLRPKTRKTKTRKAKTWTTKSNQCDFLPFSARWIGRKGKQRSIFKKHLFSKLKNIKKKKQKRVIKTFRGNIFVDTRTWPINQEIITERKNASRNLGITDVSGYRKNFTSQVPTRFGLLSLLYARCLACFEAISARFSDFPAPDINSKGQMSYCATRSHFLLAALLPVQKLRLAKRVIMALKVLQINCS